MYRFDMVVLFTQKRPISLLVLNKKWLIDKSRFLLFLHFKLGAVLE